MGFVPNSATGILKAHILPTHYVALYTVAPGADGSGGVEPSAASGYARARVGELDDSILAQVANKNIIFFNETLGSWGTVTHFGLCAGSTGAPYFVGQLTEPVEIVMEDDQSYVPIFRAHALVIGLDKAALEPYV